MGKFKRVLNELYNDVDAGLAGTAWVKDFDNWEPAASRPMQGEWRLAADVSEEELAYIIKVDVPGITKEDIKLKITEDRVMVLSAARKSEQESEEQDGKLRSSERQYGRFSRLFRLPKDVDADSITAEAKDGVLTISLPKVVDSSAEKDKEIAIS